MTMTKALMAATALVLTTAATPALAHEANSPSYDYSYNRHARDHAAHYRFHREVNEAHRRAHEEGFYSNAEHRAYHRALRDLHGDFHENHPGTRHDHYRWSRYWWR
jgi:hypothetical protein